MKSFLNLFYVLKTETAKRQDSFSEDGSISSHNCPEVSLTIFSSKSHKEFFALQCKRLSAWVQTDPDALMLAIIR